jgi:hypothetical protein
VNARPRPVDSLGESELAESASDYGAVVVVGAPAVVEVVELVEVEVELVEGEVVEVAVDVDGDVEDPVVGCRVVVV